MSLELLNYYLLFYYEALLIFFFFKKVFKKMEKNGNLNVFMWGKRCDV